MAEDESNIDILPKGTLVKVSGLKSAAGAKLNGSHGIILGSSKVDSKNVRRYPVLLFAMLEEGGSELKPVLMDAPRNKVKEENLTEINADNDKNILDLFYKSTLSHMHSAHELGEHDGSIMFVAEQCHQQLPEELELATLYCKAIVEEQPQKMDKAAHILKGFVPKLDSAILPSVYDDVSDMYNDFAFMLMKGNDCLEEALECASKIEDPEKAVHMLKGLSAECSQIHQRTQNQEAANVLLQAMQKANQFQPNDSQLTELLGSAYNIAGQHLQAAKIFRSVLDTRDVSKSLVLAQLQCPGMPLEDKQVMSTSGGVAFCVDKEGDHAMAPNRGPGGMSVMMTTSPPTRYTLPTDPNDPNHFPEWLLEQVRPE